MARYPILQSGFCALSEKGLVHADTQQGNFQTMLLMRDYTQIVNKYFYHARIEEMYRKWVVTPAFMQNMEFREEVLKLAKELLGGTSFVKWLAAQTASDRIGPLHGQFLQETADMLLKGIPRKTHISLWHLLLDSSVASRSVNVDYSEYFQQGAKSSSSPTYAVNASLPSVLSNWTGMPDGFDDLFTFLYVVYGNKSVRRDVAHRSPA